MRRISFTEEESAAIGRDRFHHPNPRVQQRMEILWLKMHGEIHERIAELAGCSRRSVQRVLDCFVAGGLNAVRQFHEKGRVNELAPLAKSLEEEFRERPPRTVAEARDRIEKLTGIRRQSTQVRAFLKQTLGLHWRKVAAIPVPPKKSVEEHAATQLDFCQFYLRQAAAASAWRMVSRNRWGSFEKAWCFPRL